MESNTLLVERLLKSLGATLPWRARSIHPKPYGFYGCYCLEGLPDPLVSNGQGAPGPMSAHV